MKWLSRVPNKAESEWLVKSPAPPILVRAAAIVRNVTVPVLFDVHRYSPDGFFSWRKSYIF